MSESIKVSILIPVYNTARYLPRCFASVQEQTLREIEIVVVNDASPDNAAEVIAEYAARDPRIRVVTHEKNGGILAARLSGIAAARGEYLIFLDADDFLAPDTARAAYQRAAATGADIVHFGFDVKVGHEKRTPFTRSLQKALAPYPGTLLGRRVFEGAFVEGLYRWNICGKFIRREVCARAAESLPPGYYVMGEDFCFYSLMAFFAKHYEPLNKTCYHYGLEIGVSAYEITDYKCFIRSCSILTALRGVRTFLEREGVFAEYAEAFEKQERNMLAELISRWEHKIVESEKAEAFSYICDHYSREAILRAMVTTLWDFEDTFASYLRNCRVLKRVPAQSGAVALCVEGNVASAFNQTVLTAAAHWRADGRRTVIATSMPHFAMPDSDWEILPIPSPLESATASGMCRRIRFWFGLREQGIDTVVYACDSPRTIWELAALRLAGLNSIWLRERSVNSLADAKLGTFLTEVRSFSFVGAAAVQSGKDVGLLQALGCPAARVPFVPEPGRGTTPAPDTVGQDLLWLGDFGDPEQTQKAVGIFAQVARSQHDMKLIMPGIQQSSAAEHTLREVIAGFHLTDRVVFTGSESDWPEFWKRSRVALLTTSPDAYAFVLASAARCAVPVAAAEGLAPEEGAAHVLEILAGHRETALPVPEYSADAEREAWRRIFALTEVPDVEDASFELDDLMRTLTCCARNYERYSLPPPACGDSFMQLYRIGDRIVNKLLPPKSALRHWIFLHGRDLAKRFGRG